MMKSFGNLNGENEATCYHKYPGSRGTVLEKLLYNLNMRTVYDLLKEQVCYSDCTAALLSAPTYYITSANSTLVYH